MERKRKTYDTLESVREKICHLYKTAPQVCVPLSFPNRKLYLNEESVVITGVFPRVFQVEQDVNGIKKRHSLLYIDVLTKQVIIKGLDIKETRD